MAIDQLAYRIAAGREKERSRNLQILENNLSNQLESEEKAVKQLLQGMESFETAQRLRQFHLVCEEGIRDRSGVPAVDSEIAIWLQWVAARADMLDPFESGKPPWSHNDLPFVIGSRMDEA